MDAPARRQLGHWGVKIVGGAQVDRVQVLRLQHGLHRIVGPAAVLLGEVLRPLPADVRAGDKLYPFQVSQYRPVNLGNAAAAHHAHSIGFHSLPPP